MRAADVDIAILGGGCAGLSLAARLARTRLSVRVIEPRTHYTNDRTWSFWRTASDPFEDCVRAEWRAWSVFGPHGETRRQSQRLRYQTLNAQSFYQRALAMIDDHSTSAISLGVKANDVHRANGKWYVATDAGAFSARTLVDTRPAKQAPRYGQFFVGREIRTSRPVFDPAVVHLMTFRPSHDGGVNFVYILPFANDQALVEVTTFAARPPARDSLTRWLEHEIASLEPGDVETLRKEAGILPMQVGFGNEASDGVIRLGLGGGASRPSTGYAFARIQAQADRVVAALERGESPNTRLDGRMTRFMDRVFLRVLATAPERAPALFECLFRGAREDRLEHFLSGSTRAADRLSVMTSLPPLPFLRAAATQL
ncbi:MAG: lycopene cyclase family protein [Chromatocurvus sp.]